MVESRLNFDIPGLSISSVPGVVPVKRPFPDLGGRLRAAYLFGKQYGKSAPEAKGRAYGPRYDWSGHEQHIEEFGRWRVEDYWLTCQVSSAVPMGPFSLGALVADPDEGVMLVAFHWAETTSKAVSLIRFVGVDYGAAAFNTTTDPFISLGLQPQTSGGRLVTVADNNAGQVQGTLNPLTNELGGIAMYVGNYATTSRRPYAQADGQAIQTGVENTTSRVLEGIGKPLMGIETGSGAGFNRLLGCAYYRTMGTTSEMTDNIRADFGEWMGAINSGLTIL